MLEPANPNLCVCVCVCVCYVCEHVRVCVHVCMRMCMPINIPHDNVTQAINYTIMLMCIVGCASNIGFSVVT